MDAAEVSGTRLQFPRYNIPAGYYGEIAMQWLLDEWSVKTDVKIWNLSSTVSVKVKFDMPLASAMRWLLARYAWHDPFATAVMAELAGDLDKFIMQAHQPYQQSSPKRSLKGL